MLTSIRNRLPSSVTYRLSGASIPKFLIVLLFAAVIYTPSLLDSRSRVSFDGSFYLSEARYIYDGQGYLREAEAERLGRPPGFPALLAASFLPNGPSLVAAAWAVRIAGFVAALVPHVSPLIFQIRAGSLFP